jgi:hypothetical protein
MPLTRTEFLEVFSAYNSAFWPVALGLWLVTAVSIVRWVVGASRGIGE